jgi:hypothetical protein
VAPVAPRTSSFMGGSSRLQRCPEPGQSLKALTENSGNDFKLQVMPSWIHFKREASVHWGA